MSTSTTDEVAHEGEKHSRPPLKLSAVKINPENVWGDDALGRERVAEALTNLIKPETSPLVLTLNGGWGTGKTFFLERWKLALEKAGTGAIYFNAWEDDYYCDPLVAIIGQLKEDLGNRYKARIEAVVKAAKNVATRAAFKLIGRASGGMIEAQITDFESKQGSLIEEYNKEKESRAELTRALIALTEAVKSETQGPLVFIIDELDRCRPTFAIELLERVKHLFGIPNLVFVLGIDRAQLRSSVSSVYGDIDVDGYLRRFFDMEFTLPPTDSEQYCRHLLERHELREHFERRATTVGHSIHKSDYEGFWEVFPLLCGQLGLSLREVEHVVRQFVFVGRNLKDRNRLYPTLISILLVLRIKDHSLYITYISRKCHSSIILEFLEKTMRFDSDKSRRAYRYLAATLYLTQAPDNKGKDPIFKQLALLAEGNLVTDESLVTARTRSLGSEEFASFYDLFKHMSSEADFGNYARNGTLDYLVDLIELSSIVLRKNQ